MPRLPWFALLIASPVLASMTAQVDDRNYVTLFEEPCKDAAVIKHIKPGYAEKFKRAFFMYQGKPFEACWYTVPDKQSRIYVIDSEGDVTPVPMAAFQAGGPGLKM
jgi:hypothetical protein